jgi:hypothetical protein
MVSNSSVTASYLSLKFSLAVVIRIVFFSFCRATVKADPRPKIVFSNSASWPLAHLSGM